VAVPQLIRWSIRRHSLTRTDAMAEPGDYLSGIIQRAFKKNGFDTLCTLLRVDGMSDPGWDPFEETRAALEEYNWILERVQEEKGDKAALRIGLLMYCQLVEMSGVHEMLCNLLRILGGEPFTITPFMHLWRRRRSLAYVPPSAKMKFREITERCERLGESRLPDLITEFFNDSIRNAFIHSDYILTAEAFRWTEGGPAKQVPRDELEGIIDACFRFYSALMQLQTGWLTELARARRFHPWPNYEVLELLSDDQGVYGFNVHFSNGSKATFSRRPDGVKAINLSFSKDQVGFFVGDLDALEPVYKVDGQPVEDWASLEE